MRILHVLGKLDRGGVETWLLQILRHIDRQKYQMDFLVHTVDRGAYDDEVLSLGARIIPCLSPSTPLLYARNFWSVLRKYGPYDVVHSHVHHYSGYVLMLAAMAGVQTRIAHSHTSAPQHSAKVGRQAYLRLMQFLIQRYASSIIVISTAAGDSLMCGWRDDDRCCLQPYGIETDAFDVSVDVARIRAELGIPCGTKVVGHVGRFAEVKNHKFILQIAAELKLTEPDVRFLLVGDGPLRPEIEAEISRMGMSGRFILVGLRSDIPELMKGAMDAFLFPSFYEGLGLVLVEAQLAGLRSVISDQIPHEADLVADMVERLPLSAPPGEWAEALRRILKSSDMWQVPETVRKQFSIEKSVAELTNCYGKAVKPFSVATPPPSASWL